MAYIKITNNCIGVEKDRYNMPISTFTFYEDELFEVSRYYNYYDADDPYWNTEHPTIIIRFDDIPKYTLCYDIPPEHYEYVELEDSTLVTTFVEHDLVERNESIINNALEKEKAVSIILEKYLEITQFEEYLWRNISE